MEKGLRNAFKVEHLIPLAMASITMRGFTLEKGIQSTVTMGNLFISSIVHYSQKTPRGERSYESSECGKSFIRISDLHCHQTVHTGQRIFKNKLIACGYVYCFGGSGKDRARENDVRQKHRLVASPTCPNEEMNPKPGHWASAVTHHQTTDLFFAGGPPTS